MLFYGRKLLIVGIAIIISVIVFAAIFFTLYFIRSSKIKKQLETEYGKNK